MTTRKARLWLLAFVLPGVILLAVLAGAVYAGDVRPIVVPTENYKLDTGDTVVIWIDEPRALLCVAMLDGRWPYAPGGLSCVPLTASTYNWPVIQPTGGE